MRNIALTWVTVSQKPICDLANSVVFVVKPDHIGYPNGQHQQMFFIQDLAKAYMPGNQASRFCFRLFLIKTTIERERNPHLSSFPHNSSCGVFTDESCCCFVKEILQTKKQPGHTHTHTKDVKHKQTRGKTCQSCGSLGRVKQQNERRWQQPIPERQSSHDAFSSSSLSLVKLNSHHSQPFSVPMQCISS